jgi:BirA family biotin operon repressor/biotin-[acetyl-CoA-carboxylase] ligase
LQNNIFSGLFVGQNLVTLKEVGSTNNFLKELLSNSKPVAEGTVIMAESQLAGRGQQQNRWFSEAGKNLTFSLLLKPVFLPLMQQFELTRVVSLGVVSALQQATGLPMQIKWPNDIYYGDKKLGGILIENLVQGGQIRNSVIGIGLNINQLDFPADLPGAVSLRQILHRDYDLKIILAEICSHTEAWYLKLKAGKVSEIRKQYLHTLYRLNQAGYFKADELVFKGTITGVRDNGLLIIDTETGEKEFNLKQIQFLINHIPR